MHKQWMLEDLETEVNAIMGYHSEKRLDEIMERLKSRGMKLMDKDAVYEAHRKKYVAVILKDLKDLIKKVEKQVA